MARFAKLFSVLTLPTLFFGYAAYANGSMLWGAKGSALQETGSVAALFNGSITSHIDTLYKTSLPHRDPSIGLVGMLRYLAFEEGRRGVIVGTDGWLFSDEEFMLPTDEGKAISQAAKEIAAVRDRLASAGVKLLVVPLPAKADLYR